MAHETSGKSLGDVVREARVAKGLSLRDLAKKLGKTPSYLSDIENDRRVPAEEVLRDLARVLDVDFDDLMARAGRLGENAVRYMMKRPAVGVLFRKLSDANAPEEVIDQLARMVDRLGKKKPEQTR